MNDHRNLILVLFTLMICVACSEQVNQKNNANTNSNIPTAAYGSVDSLMPHKIKDSKQEKLSREFHENGQVKSEGIYIASLKEGLHKEWADNGILLLEGYYKKGKANGLMKWFHERGHIAGEGNMVDGIREGPWKICDIEENGFCIEAYFKNGKRNGIWKIYHKNSRDKLWKEQSFIDDKIVSERCWDENGKAIECE